MRMRYTRDGQNIVYMDAELVAAQLELILTNRNDLESAVRNFRSAVLSDLRRHGVTE